MSFLDEFHKVNDYWYRHKSGIVAIRDTNYGTHLDHIVLYQAYNRQTGRLINQWPVKFKQAVNDAIAYVSK